jgi:hypothetical protein
MRRRFERPFGQPHDHPSRGRSFGGNVLGGIVGGLIGSAIANSTEEEKPVEKSPTPKPIAASSELENVLKRVTQVPVGGTVFLKVEEFRVLTDKGLVNYKETVPYCMERIIEV